MDGTDGMMVAEEEQGGTCWFHFIANSTQKFGEVSVGCIMCSLLWETRKRYCTEGALQNTRRKRLCSLHSKSSKQSVTCCELRSGQQRRNDGPRRARKGGPSISIVPLKDGSSTATKGCTAADMKPPCSHPACSATLNSINDHNTSGICLHLIIHHNIPLR